MANKSDQQCKSELMLSGLDGSNPLGFLAALGVHQTLGQHYPKENILMRWTQCGGVWLPVLINNPVGVDVFCENLEEILRGLSREPFQIENKLPFDVSKFRKNALDFMNQGNQSDRRNLDILAGFGSDAIANKDGIFQDTKLRMIRAGDSVGNGFPAYSLSICEETGALDLQRTLFRNWDYSDKGTSLRIDPNEDRQYALRGGDPSKESTLSMRGANRLAIEAMALMYTAPSGKSLGTAGFTELGKKCVYWTWPIWKYPISINTAKSVISLPMLQEESMNNHSLSAFGIAVVFRCRRIATSKYYNNLSPSFAVM
jgi:hypothetical protein